MFTVRNAETDEIKYRVWMCGQSESGKIKDMLDAAWGPYGAFNFADLDGLFDTYRKAENKIRTAVLRLQYPIDLNVEDEKKYRVFLKRYGAKLVPDLIQSGDVEAISTLLDCGITKPDILTAWIELASSLQQNEVLALFIAHSSTIEGNSLSFSKKLPEEWTVKKNAPNAITRYNGTDLEVEFPSVINETQITTLADVGGKTPNNYKSIRRVVIPVGYSEIGANAFKGCTALEEIILPEGLLRIGNHCFEDCISLRRIHLPHSVITIGNSAFQGCTTLEEIIFSKELTEIGSNAFAGCRSLKEIDLGEKVRKIGSSCFTTAGLETVIFRGKSCYCPEHMCFNYPHYVYTDGTINALGIPASKHMPLSYVGYKSEEIKKQSSKDFLRGHVISSSGKLKAFPESGDLALFVETLGGHYSGRLGKDVDVLVTYQVIQTHPDVIEAASKGILVLSELEFLDLIKRQEPLPIVSRDESTAKKATKEQKTKKQDKDDPYRPAVMKKLWAFDYMEDGSIRLTNYKGREEAVQIPERIGTAPVTVLGEWLFSKYKERRSDEQKNYLSNVSKIVIPGSIHTIESLVFWGCEGLKEINIPETVQNIGSKAFSCCFSLADRDGFTIVRDVLYAYCGNRSAVHVPSTVKKIESEAFYDHDEITEILIPKQVQEIGSSAFSGCKGLADENGFVVIRGILYGYYKNEIALTIPDCVQDINPMAFAWNTVLKEIRISNSVSKIGFGAFMGCQLTIHAPAGSYAEQYAKENNIPFVAE